MNDDEMNYENLDPEEQEIIRRFRELSQAKKKAVTSSQESFIDWIKTSLSWVWNKIQGYANDLWSWLKSLF
ncbi:hypothetical protein PN450_09765 [Dolichospermum lemmermannii CS-548]|jgi:hypothetical protein|uniref:hypothetical protein n=1 Tax=Dolichospermum lemmermannii TaxID=54295 RepID=UPI00232CEF3A|nr:hypothetical protein [Dolichospermum lemmermannii]MDB9437081.1 hypothetical protein [Dolichospermum lemmermannii CS-548]